MPTAARSRFQQLLSASVHGFVKRPVADAALLALVLLAPPMAQAQATTTRLDRVEVTGSAIKRLEGETALPVQVITRADIIKAGVTTAAELMATVSASAKNLTDGASINTNDRHGDQMGFNSANLRGLGASSTLVLLNGRRLANFASPGDDAGVDLNNIPAAAIQRVEILLDGASALYGADAIGGVINFITRKDYQGAEIYSQVGATREGGAGKRMLSLAAGAGDVSREGFNVFGVLDVQQTDALRTSQRKFISDLKVPERLPHLLSSAPFPGNIRLSSDQRDHLQSVDFKIAGKPIVNRTINLGAPTCNAPSSLYLPLGIGGEDACTYDYMRDVELYPKSDKLSFLGRGVLQLGSSHQAFAELSFARAKTWYVGTPNRMDGELDVSRIPQLAATGLADALPDDRSITVRTRLTSGGNRASELTSTGQRVVLGLTGQVSSWDYDLGLTHSVNTVADRDVRGYYLKDKAYDGFSKGLINPFASGGPAEVDFLKSISINEQVRSARGTLSSLDAKASRVLSKLEGGDLTLALGGELRREHAQSSASDLLISDNILGDRSPSDSQFTNHGRRVWALFGELNAPLTKQLELQLAVRHDSYEKVGSSTNPKLGLRYTPTKEVLVRASAGTGFRAPSLNDLYRPIKVSSTATLPDPVCMKENDNDLAYCANNWETHTYSNPNLKPERSRQLALGLVFEPNAQWTVSADYWNVLKSDVISTLGDDVILGNLDKYGSLVRRYSEPAGPANSEFMRSCGDYLDPDDHEICYIELRKENRGKERVSGLDLMVDLHGVKTEWGTFGAKLNGTVVIESKRQTGFGDPYVSNLGRFVTDGAVQRWRHRLTLDWEQGPYSLALSNSYLSGYTDQNSAIDTNSGTRVQANQVKAYSLWDVSGAWNATKQLTLRAGVRNMFDTAPPYSNQATFFISGYDPTYTDPRGRYAYVGLQYLLK